MSQSTNLPYVTKLGGFSGNAFQMIVGQGPPNIYLKRAPGAFYLDEVAQIFYSSAGVINNVATWIALGTLAGSLATINSLLPTIGNIVIAGTANQVQIANAGSTVTLSLPAAVTAPGSVTSTTTMSAGTDLSSTAGFVSVSGTGKTLRVKGGAVTDFIGTATLTAGTVTVANTNISADDRIFLSVSNVNASTKLGHLTYTISAGASFTILSRASANLTTETNDVSTIAYFIARQI